jgi:hypothetical protein
VLFLQHPILVLVFKQKLCCSVTWCLGSVCSFDFFFCLSEPAAWSALPSVGYGSLNLYALLRFWNQFCRPPAVPLWSWDFTVLDYWGLVSLPCPLSLGQGQWSASQSPAVSVLWLFDYFQFCSVIWLQMLLTGSGDEVCDCYLPYFRQ